MSEDCLDAHDRSELLSNSTPFCTTMPSANVAMPENSAEITTTKGKQKKVTFDETTALHQDREETLNDPSSDFTEGYAESFELSLGSVSGSGKQYNSAAFKGYVDELQEIIDTTEDEAIWDSTKQSLRDVVAEHKKTLSLWSDAGIVIPDNLPEDIEMHINLPSGRTTLYRREDLYEVTDGSRHGRY